MLAFMPAEQGVVNWPAAGRSASALVDTGALPLPDSCVDRVLLIHALEITEHPRDLLAEVWRVLTPGGRVVAVTPSRAGLWARVDSTPFGHGQPYSRSQLRDLLRETLFSPTHWTEALYMPPIGRQLFLRSAPAFETLGARLALPGAGVLGGRGGQAALSAHPAAASCRGGWRLRCSRCWCRGRRSARWRAAAPLKSPERLPISVPGRASGRRRHS